MTTTYVLDTNIILNDHRNILAFSNNIVVIPNIVTSEIDHKKSLGDELGYHARRFSDSLDELRQIGKLKNGVPLENGGTLMTMNAPQKSKVYTDFGEITNDLRIVATALLLKEQGHDVVLVSNDTNVRIMADEYVNAEKLLSDQVISSEDEGYKGFTSLTVDDSIVSSLKSAYKIPINLIPETTKYPENHCFILNGYLPTLKIDGDLKKTYPYNEGVWDVVPRNHQQEIALNLLMNKDIPVVTLEGTAGSGKTLMSLASGLLQTLDEKYYNKLIYMKPPIENEFELGFLPGELSQKLAPHMQPAFDNLEVLFNCKNRKELDHKLIGYDGIIEFEHIGHMRGRSIPKAFIVVDEAQNLTKHGVKTLLTRLGEGSKMILLGDPKQIDNRYVDSLSNGLTYVIEKLKQIEQHGHVSLPKSERSTIAQLCADML
jgi:PhoH-like ATPase